MKKIIFAIVAAASINVSAEYVTVTVCDRGENGNRCETITYKKRAPSAPVPQVETCYEGENQRPVACNQNAHVPNWLKKLNEALLNAGFTAPKEDDIYRGH